MKRLALVLAFAMGITFVQAKQANPLASVPVTDAQGFLTNGNFEVKRFIGKQGQVWAIGIFRGTIGGKQITHGLQVPVTLSEGSAAIAQVALKKNESKADGKSQVVQCEILNIAFGPADITVLGLHLQVAPIAVNITAEDAPADLLCSIIELTGVVGTVLDTVVGLLNTLLGLLGGLVG